MKLTKSWLSVACIVGIMTLGACTSSLKAPATADVAVSQAAIDNANSADGTEFAPVDMRAARAKLVSPRLFHRGSDGRHLGVRRGVCPSLVSPRDVPRP